MSETPLLQITTLRYYLFGLALAPIFMAFFGTSWWGMGELSQVLPGGNLTSLIIFILVDIILLAGAIWLILRARQLPVDRSPAAKALGKEKGRYYGRWFGSIFGLEIIVILIANILIYKVFKRPAYSMPVIAIIVGLHFLPLASVFQVRAYYITGTLVALVGVVVMLAIPATQTFGSARAWDVVLGITCSIILWITGGFTLLMARNKLQQTQVLLAGIHDTAPPAGLIAGDAAL
ncbi:DUF7010 family protein [Dictyobacter kobayashii]|uniref:Uncharacterized protein n=1 Tax=Dictyobacter kobayashii TaxID=2014872 RepID=A0A402AIA6_9CHLR|nr:hypothetical protein [Dictyobacter kobayashii]GCE18847.1 hypothetical protein KDK_26470 [Dictyobacter kobayashii]